MNTIVELEYCTDRPSYFKGGELRFGFPSKTILRIIHYNGLAWFTYEYESLGLSQVDFAKITPNIALIEWENHSEDENGGVPLCLSKWGFKLTKIERDT